MTLPSVQSYASLTIHENPRRRVEPRHREGDRLAENRVFIDLLYFLKQQGLDVLERTKHIGRR